MSQHSALFVYCKENTRVPNYLILFYHRAAGEQYDLVHEENQLNQLDRGNIHSDAEQSGKVVGAKHWKHVQTLERLLLCFGLQFCHTHKMLNLLQFIQLPVFFLT